MMLTNWGYTLKDVDMLPDMLTVTEFDDFTACKYKGDIRIESEITAAESAIRNYVGWHLAGPLKCEYEADTESTSRVIQVPTRYLSDVSRIAVDGRELDQSEYTYKTNGLIRLKNPTFSSGWNDIDIEYTAGLPDELMGAIKELIMHRVTHALANSYGIQSESSGGVSVTYSATWANSARATALPADNKEVLAPYRLQGVF